MARPERRAGLGCGVAIITGATVLTVVVLAAIAVFTLVPRGGPTAAAIVQTQPGAATWDPSQPTTLLLVEKGDRSGEAATSLSVLSYVPQQRRLAFLAIPANLWVTVPGFGQAELGQAYADGGIRLLLLTTQSVLGVPIPYYAVARAGTVAQIIDAFGGVTVDVPGRATLGTAARAIGPGPVHLNGADAETYLRSLPAPDYSTGQSAFLTLVRVSQTKDNQIRLPSVLNSLGAAVTTNFPMSGVPSLLSMLGNLRPAQITQTDLGADTATATPYTTSGMQVFLPHRDQIRALARSLVSVTSLAGSVEVLNGSGVPGQAAALAAWLRSAAIPVRGFATAPSGNYPHTRVIVGPKAGTSAHTLGQTVATLLQVPVVTGSVPGHRQAVIVIIGRDFQNPAQQ